MAISQGIPAGIEGWDKGSSRARKFRGDLCDSLKVGGRMFAESVMLQNW